MRKTDPFVEGVGKGESVKQRLDGLSGIEGQRLRGQQVDHFSFQTGRVSGHKPDVLHVTVENHIVPHVGEEIEGGMFRQQLQDPGSLFGSATK